jgi:Bacterial capsule synthesis protein PGA_cap
VSADELKALKAIRRNAYAAPPGTTNVTRLDDPASEPADRVQLFGLSYKVGTPGTRSFAMNQGDLTEILRAIRNGKYLSEFMIATCHCHQGPVLAQQWLFEDQIPDFLPQLARATIDNGADMFVGHGPHVLRGIEIYKGKPIFYGLGEFFRQMDVVGLAGLGRGRGDENSPPIKYDSVVALTRYEGGRVAEIRLHPLELTDDVRMARRGIPRTASAAGAQRILSRLQKLSAPLGTTITVEGNIGVIRPAPMTTASGGQ